MFPISKELVIYLDLGGGGVSQVPIRITFNATWLTDLYIFEYERRSMHNSCSERPDHVLVARVVALSIWNAIDLAYKAGELSEYGS